MFERLTDRARLTIVFAQEEARGLGHNYIGTEHLLLGLIHEGEGVAAQALHRLRVNLDDVRKEAAELVPPAEAMTGHAPFSIRAKRVLERAVHEATALGVNHIGTEHILLALISEEPREGEPESTAWQILDAHGLNREWAREIVLIDFLGLAPADEN